MNSLPQFARLMAVTGIAAVSALATSSACAEAQTAQSDATMETVWTVDSRGRPPFKRSRSDVPVVDVAAMEIPEAVEMTTVWSVDRSGHPPFKRKRVQVPVIDAASLEVSGDTDTGPRFRGKPPFKRHR